ncbi:hypothetical protein DEU56DRAFT_978296 [Suillus clintonianus]|uniref:uncharacterized protein n=1 Tax=Suillus clintonianus TaxID=1904413 RepID=UPI001B87F25B|nr:uncharacterized protein DEU56DRAFT_978296 [Suillus clintonianus]KAG2148055.1 hypothetical protein DEU56DRAFT_978296 [Suillus clintonianus]
MRWHPDSQICLLLLMHAVANVAAINFTQCLNDILANANATQSLAGLLDGNGDPVSNASDATSITYALCKSACGKGAESFQWSIFSQDLGAWLLPNLALISQLPFGARYRPDNFMSAALTVGSPVLAGYSLFITLLNSVWINRKFDTLKKTSNSISAASILSSLQQVPLRLDPDLVKSLIVLPQNDCWLRCFSEFVNYTHTWSFASATAIAWVVAAFVISVVNSPVDIFIGGSSQADGTATGSLWLWLIPIVVGWLQLSPKCDFYRLQEAYERADQHARTGCTHMGTSTTSTRRALTITAPDNDVSSPDELLTPPVFNYSRSFRWASTAHMMFLEFEAEEKYQTSTRVSLPTPNRQSDSSETLRVYHTYPPLPHNAQHIHWAPGVFIRIFFASCASLALQWGTAGAAFMTAWFTPTTRIGCRSISYLIYGSVSTGIWLLLLVSSILAHYSVQPPSHDTYPASHYHRALSLNAETQNISYDSYDYLSNQKRLPARRLQVWARRISHLLRWAGKALAIANSIWVVLACTFVYSGFYDTCFCNGSVFGRGEAAYSVIIENTAQAAQLKAASIGALAMACVTSVFFIGIVNLYIYTRPRL